MDPVIIKIFKGQEIARGRSLVDKSKPLALHVLCGGDAAVLPGEYHTVAG